MTYYDAHCHLHEYSDNDIKDFLDNDLVIVGVSDDLESTVRTLKLREKFGEKSYSMCRYSPVECYKDS